MKELSDWQRSRVRDALRAYHRYERGAEGEYFTWKDVREAIAEYTGVDVGTNAKNGAERLRQFVEGIDDKTAPTRRRYPAPMSTALEAIVAFVTHEELNLLNEDELRENIPSFQASLRLLEYLDDGSETGRMIPPNKLQGVYESIANDTEQFTIRQFTLQRPGEEGIIQVVETEDTYPIGDYIRYEEWGPAERAKYQSSHIQNSGWAILTPEDNLFFFLKNEQNSKNLYYYTVAASTTLWTENAPYPVFAIINHHFPLEIEPVKFVNPQTVRSRAKKNVASKVLIFKKCESGSEEVYGEEDTGSESGTNVTSIQTIRPSFQEP